MSFFTEAILPHLSDDLRRAEYRGNPDPVAGHCYIVAEVIYHILGVSGLTPMFIRHEGQPHWYLRDDTNGTYIDPTGSQFKTLVPWENGRGKGFLTKGPSLRAVMLLDRMDLH